MCDVGHNDADLCCYSAKEPVGVQCRLKPGKVCRYSTNKHTQMIKLCIKASQMHVFKSWVCESEDLLGG